MAWSISLDLPNTPSSEKPPQVPLSPHSHSPQGCHCVVLACTGFQDSHLPCPQGPHPQSSHGLLDFNQPGGSLVALETTQTPTRTWLRCVTAVGGQLLNLSLCVLIRTMKLTVPTFTG